MSLLFRIAVYLPVLFLIAIVVVGQQHTTAQETIRASVAKTDSYRAASAAQRTSRAKRTA